MSIPLRGAPQRALGSSGASDDECLSLPYLLAIGWGLTYPPTGGKEIVMRKFVWAAVLAFMASGAQAATLNVDGATGQLLGASGVEVGGILYNVVFLDGTCIDLYGGCEDDFDFTFQSSEDALEASQVLLDLVFIDGPLGNFDTESELTNECGGSFCNVYTPFKGLEGEPLWPVLAAAAYNAGLSGNNPDHAGVVPTTYVETGCWERVS